MTNLAEPVLTPNPQRLHHEGRCDVATAYSAVPAPPANRPINTSSGGIGDLIDEVARFRVLADDWDGEGSCAPEPSAIVSAMRFLANFGDDWMPWVAPTTDGGVRVEWSGVDSFLMLDFEPDDHATLSYRMPGRDAIVMVDHEIPSDLTQFYASVRSRRG